MVPLRVIAVRGDQEKSPVQKSGIGPADRQVRRASETSLAPERTGWNQCHGDGQRGGNQ